MRARGIGPLALHVKTFGRHRVVIVIAPSDTPAARRPDGAGREVDGEASGHRRGNGRAAAVHGAGAVLKGLGELAEGGVEDGAHDDGEEW